MEQRIHEIIQECYCDLEDAAAQVGEELDAEGLADFIGDRMYDESEDYRNTPYNERRALALSIAREYC